MSNPDYAAALQVAAEEMDLRAQIADLNRETELDAREARVNFHQWVHNWLWGLYFVQVAACTTFGLCWVYYSPMVATIAWLSLLFLVVLMTGYLQLRTWAFNRWFENAMEQLANWRNLDEMEPDEPEYEDKTDYGSDESMEML